MIPDPNAWDVAVRLHATDSTRLRPAEVARYSRYLIRTDRPIARPVVWRRPRREQRVVNALTAVVALGMAAWLALLLWGGAQLVRSLADAAVRLMGGAS